MFDYELFAPDDTTMRAALTAFSMRTTNSGKVGTTVYATDYYGTKFLSSGTGLNTIWTAQPGVYCNIRWVGASVLTLTQTLINQGCVLQLIAAPFFRVFAAP